jgi:hypothetical protein
MLELLKRRKKKQSMLELLKRRIKRRKQAIKSIDNKLSMTAGFEVE